MICVELPQRKGTGEDSAPAMCRQEQPGDRAETERMPMLLPHSALSAGADLPQKRERVKFKISIKPIDLLDQARQQQKGLWRQQNGRWSGRERGPDSAVGLFGAGRQS
jgi:hypothetical protein